MASELTNSNVEQRRLARLRSYGVLDGAEDPVLNQYAKMAAEIAGTPIAMVSLVGAEWQFAKGSYGDVAPQLPRHETFCAHVVTNPNDRLVVNDLSKDERFAQNKFVSEGPKLRFYAGMGLDGNGEGSIGSFCVMDTVPRHLSEMQLEHLQLLAKAVMTRIELTRMVKRWEELTGESTKGSSWNAEGRTGMVAEIKLGLARDEFINFYQPKFDLHTGKIIGAEALIRWHHPTRGIVMPDEFIPLMEITGLIVEAGSSVLKRSMKCWRALSERGLTPPPIAVNVAASQFINGDLVSLVEAALAASGNQDANPLSIEVTESGLLSNRIHIAEQLQAIRALGVTVALDDFGTGYSSLSYLATLPVDILKIDRSFVMKMLQEPDYTTLVNTIIQLSHGLGLKVVAEGIETKEEAQMLKLLRCDQAQGYFYSKPVSEEVYADMLVGTSGY